MNRIRIAPDAWRLAEVELDSEQAHHLLHVLKAPNGTRVHVFDGAGKYGEAILEWRDRRGAILRIEADARIDAEPLPRISLIQAIPKGKRMDVLLEKTTELGVSRIFPVITERTLVRPSASEAARMKNRWERIVEAACCQCGRRYVPEVMAPTALPVAVATLRALGETLLFGALGSDVPLMRDALKRLEVGAKPSSLTVAIGPEGDFSPDENEQLRAAGAAPVSFGATILRTETAAIYAVAVLSCAFRSV